MFTLGLALLAAGAEALVRGASRLAAAVGISPLVIGLTVVAFGTSSPELAVSVRSALSGDAGSEIALGNVVGSNIFNVLFILGLSAIVTPLVVSKQLVRLDVPIMIGVSFLLLLMGQDGKVSRLEGLVLFSGIVVYTVFAIRQGLKENRRSNPGGARPSLGVRRAFTDLILVALGLCLLVVGAEWMVDGAVSIAQALGVSALVISLTIVAIGTSLPEVATSVLASIRGERDIAVGNLIGSNIFNLLAVLGLSATVGPDGITVSPAALNFDVPVMTAVAVACLPIFFTGLEIARWEGLLFLSYYVIYASYVFLAATRHDALPALSGAMLFFVLPLTGVTLIVVALWEVRLWRRNRRLY